MEAFMNLDSTKLRNSISFWSWMIVPNQITVPVRIGTVVRDFGTILFGSVRGTKLFGSVRGSWFWYEILVRYYLVRYVVRSFWYETQWFGSCSDSWFVISVPVRNGSVRFVIFKKMFFSDRTDYEPTYLVRNRFGPNFRKKIFKFVGPFTYQISWFVIGSVRKNIFWKYNLVRISLIIFSKKVIFFKN